MVTQMPLKRKPFLIKCYLFFCIWQENLCELFQNLHNPFATRSISNIINWQQLGNRPVTVDYNHSTAKYIESQ